MKTATKRAAEVYRLLVKLYPQTFQAAFGDEMVEVFVARLTAAAENGVSGVFSIYMHESRGFLTSLIREHLAGYSERQRGMKRTISTIVVLSLLTIVLLAHRIVAIYFCNLANPLGGGMGNRVACRIVYQDAGGPIVTLIGVIALAGLLTIVMRATFLRKKSAQT